LKEGAGTIEGIAAQWSTIGAKLIPVVLNPKFAMGAGVIPAPPPISSWRSKIGLTNCAVKFSIVLVPFP